MLRMPSAGPLAGSRWGGVERLEINEAVRVLIGGARNKTAEETQPNSEEMPGPGKTADRFDVAKTEGRHEAVGRRKGGHAVANGALTEEARQKGLDVLHRPLGPSSVSWSPVRGKTTMRS